MAGLTRQQKKEYEEQGLVLIHRGGQIREQGSDRHVLANHHIRYRFGGWPHRSWTRHAFDGRVRLHPAPEETLVQ